MLTNLISKSDYSVLDSLYVVVLSMGFIFIVLAFLMGILYISPKVIKKVEDWRNGSKNNQTQSQKEDIIKENLSHQDQQNQQDEEQLVSAITVAITQTRLEQNILAPFVIKKIKRK